MNGDAITAAAMLHSTSNIVKKDYGQAETKFCLKLSSPML